MCVQPTARRASTFVSGGTSPPNWRIRTLPAPSPICSDKYLEAGIGGTDHPRTTPNALILLNTPQKALSHPKHCCPVLVIQSDKEVTPRGDTPSTPGLKFVRRLWISMQQAEARSTARLIAPCFGGGSAQPDPQGKAMSW